MIGLDWKLGQREREWGALRCAYPGVACRAAEHPHPPGAGKRSETAGGAAPKRRLPGSEHPPRTAEAPRRHRRDRETPAQSLSGRARIRVDAGGPQPALRRRRARALARREPRRASSPGGERSEGRDQVARRELVDDDAARSRRPAALAYRPRPRDPGAELPLAGATAGLDAPRGPRASTQGRSPGNALRNHG